MRESDQHESSESSRGVHHIKANSSSKLKIIEMLQGLYVRSETNKYDT